MQFIKVINKGFLLVVMTFIILVLNGSANNIASANGTLPFPSPYRSAGPAPYSESTPMWQMNFEGSGCDDSSSNAFYSCIAANGADPDCGSGTSQCPLEQTLSGDMKGDDTIRMSQYYPSSAATLTLDFLFTPISFANSNGARTTVGGFYDGDNKKCSIDFGTDSTGNNRYLYANSAGNGSPVSLNQSAPYRVRLRYYASIRLCVVNVSTVAFGRWDGSNILSGSTYLGGPAAPTTNVGFMMNGTVDSDSNRFIIDDIALCNNAGASPTTQCDGT
jgi:hypothetical protein